MKFKLFLIIGLAGLLAFSGFAVKALTSAETQTKIAEIKAQINQLLVQVAQMQSQSPAETVDLNFCHTFENVLQIGNMGSEVRYLQSDLEKQGFTVSSQEKNASYFGSSTAFAVTKFQEKYAQSILWPLGLTRGTGKAAARTLVKLNQLYGCQQQVAPACVPDWRCSEWTNCKDGKNTKTCSDANRCGVLTNKPAESKSCVAISERSSCQSTAECSYGYFCQNGSCAKISGGCLSDAECQYGKCVNGTCGKCSVVSDCKSDKMWCVAETCITKSCSSDADCDSGKTCSRTTWACVSPQISTSDVCKTKSQKYGANAVCVPAAGPYIGGGGMSCSQYCASKNQLLEKATVITDAVDFLSGASCGRANYADQCCVCKDSCSSSQKCVEVLDSNASQSCNNYCNSINEGSYNLLSSQLTSCKTSAISSGVCCMCKTAGRCGNNLPLSECATDNDKTKDAKTVCDNYCSSKYKTTGLKFFSLDTQNTGNYCQDGAYSKANVCCQCNKVPIERNCIGNGETTNYSLPCCPGLTLSGGKCAKPVSACLARGAKKTAYAANQVNCCSGLFATFIGNAQYECKDPIPGTNCAAEGSNANFPEKPCCNGLTDSAGTGYGICQKSVESQNCIGADKIKQYHESCCSGLLFQQAVAKDNNTEYNSTGYCLTPRCSAGAGSACAGF